MDKEFVQNNFTLKNEMEVLIAFALTNLVPLKHFCTEIDEINKKIKRFIDRVSSSM